jgi:hypothetical protein
MMPHPSLVLSLAFAVAPIHLLLMALLFLLARRYFEWALVDREAGERNRGTRIGLHGYTVLEQVSGAAF